MKTALLLLCVLACGVPAQAEVRLSVGSKAFSESRLLAEIFAQTLEANGDFEVTRRFNLAGTAVCFRALQAGEIHLYPEYTGTGLATILGEDVGGTAAEVLVTVRREFAARYDLAWLAPLGFENSYEVAVRREIADERDLVTISDLAARSEGLTAAFGFEFQQREDGLVGLRRVYGYEPGRLLSMQQNLKYSAAGDAKIDVLDVYTTDGLILVHDLVVLEDDLGVFPPYQAAALVHGETLREYPAIATALARLAGTCDEASRRDLNRQVEVEGISVEAVASAHLARLWIVDAGVETVTAQPRRRGFLDVMVDSRASLVRRTLEHLALVFAALALSILVAVPTGLVLERRRNSAEAVVAAFGVLQTIPSIALLAFMIPVLGVGTKPAIAALFLYGLFPIVRNTYTGVRDADPDASISALALGMTPSQVLWRVRFPLALPIVFAGIRTAAVISVGTATLAAFIGAGGLGAPIVSGLQLNDSAIVMSGAIPAALLALAVDAGLGFVERRLAPRR